MKFTKTEPDENFRAGRWVSENNVWEFGFCPVMYGVRVRAGKIGNGWITLDYCAGDDKEFALILFATVGCILMALPETVTEQQVQRLFPAYETKPISLDPTCWERLKELAAQVEEGRPILLQQG